MELWHARVSVGMFFGIGGWVGDGAGVEVGVGVGVGDALLLVEVGVGFGEKVIDGDGV